MSDITTPKSDAIAPRARELAEDMGRAAAREANQVGNKGMTALGDGLEKAASFLDSKVADHRLDLVTKPAHEAAEYLRKKDPESALSDIDRSIHNHPYRAMAVALGVGWVIGRLMRSRD